MPEPLVLVPGLACDARLFAAQMVELGRDRAVMVGPVGPGERIEEIASDLLMAAPQRFALAGHGLGGMVAMEMLRRAPDRLTRIALIDTDPLADTPQIAAAWEPMIARARAGRLDEVMRDWLHPGGLAPGPRRAAVLGQALDMARDMGAARMVRQIRALQRRRDAQATLRKCRLPALVLCGAEDALMSVRRHRFMAELIPHAELRIIDGAGYLPMLEQPEATGGALRDWLAQPYILR